LFIAIFRQRKALLRLGPTHASRQFHSRRDDHKHSLARPHGNWHHYQTKQNQADVYRVAQRRAESTKKRHRLVDDAVNT